MISTFDVYETTVGMDSDSDSLNEYLQNIIVDYNYNPFILIKNFIISDILPNYDNLADCTLFREDEYGEPSIEFYIKFVGNLSFTERKQLHRSIIEEIKEYAIDSDFLDDFKEISVFLVR